MHGRTARASIDECAQRATTHSSSTRPGCRASGRSRRYGLSRAGRVRVASGSGSRPAASRPAVMTTSPPATGQRAARPGRRAGDAVTGPRASPRADWRTRDPPRSLLRVRALVPEAVEVGDQEKLEIGEHRMLLRSYARCTRRLGSTCSASAPFGDLNARGAHGRPHRSPHDLFGVRRRARCGAAS
jgi:hypothetical protein